MDESGKNPIEEIAFQMVTAVNDARVNYLKAVHAARNRDFAVAQQYIEAGDDRYSAGHGMLRLIWTKSVRKSSTSSTTSASPA